MKNQRLKIALGDLRHNTTGRHSAGMPIGIGYVASYLLGRVDPSDAEVRFYDDPNMIINDINSWKPSVIGLSNFCWNADLSCLVYRYAKKVIPNIICVSGGPEFPSSPEDCRQYLLERPEIDFFVYLEGEIAFTNLIRKILAEEKVSKLKSEPQDGIMAIHPGTRALIAGEPIPRLTNLDEIPSPYLTGLMDQWFNGSYIPSLETTRGCPFSCGFCFAGRPWFSDLTTFSIERTKAELTCISERMKAYPSIPLSICDANFGMYLRDEEIAEHIRLMQDTYGWPRAIEVTTGKNHYDRILKIASRLKNQMYVTCSLQSLNPKTLDVIKRKNLPINVYEEIQSEIKSRGMISVAEIIAPLPEETRESFFAGVKTLVEAGVERIVPYTTMLLKQTYIASEDCRNKYGMKTKYRIIPHGFGEYEGEKCFETEEVCVATNTMPFEDYLDCRGFALVSFLFAAEQFDVIRRHIKELKLNAYDYLFQLWVSLKASETELADVYNEFIQETKSELLDSKSDIYKYFSKPEMYTKLLNGELGDNLLRKYSTIIYLRWSALAIELAYSTLKKITGNTMMPEIQRSIDAARKWMIKTRDIGYAIGDRELTEDVKLFSLTHDILAWYEAGPDSPSLTDFERPVQYKITCPVDRIKVLMGEAEGLYGTDTYYQMGKILNNWSIKTFWRRCERITED